MTVEELKAVLVSMGVDEALITPEAVREEVGLDSLGIAELALVMNQERGVPVTEEQLHGVVTVAEVVALLDRLAARANGAAAQAASVQAASVQGTSAQGASAVPAQGTRARTAGAGGAA
ncbi:acyl carrier protein [Streptomyces axinellae]|uniref:Carrier domain-containing protein n=1 Tax=Streptomyces axinellae TaxID=552788 RepID=A0ABP6CCA5_9ACTN